MSLPSQERFKCEILSWNRVARDSKKLSKIVRNSGYKPHIVVAIGRGGLIPARILCDYLLMKDLTTIKVEHWGIAATLQRRAIIKFPLCVDIKDKRVLLVDDITDTGETLRVSLEYLKSLNPKEVRTAVLIHKTSSTFIPDYYVSKIVKWRWVIFPWHIWEDLVGFVQKIKATGIHYEEAIHKELKTRYNIDVPLQTVQEVLSEA